MYLDELSSKIITFGMQQILDMALLMMLEIQNSEILNIIAFLLENEYNNSRKAGDILLVWLTPLIRINTGYIDLRLAGNDKIRKE